MDYKKVICRPLSSKELWASKFVGRSPCHTKKAEDKLLRRKSYDILRASSLFTLLSCSINSDLQDHTYWAFATSAGSSTAEGLQYNMELVVGVADDEREVWWAILSLPTSDEDIVFYSLEVKHTQFMLEGIKNNTCRWRLDGRIDSDSFLCGTLYECTNEATENVITRTFGARRIKNPWDYHEQAYVNCDREAVDWQLER